MEEVEEEISTIRERNRINRVNRQRPSQSPNELLIPFYTGEGPDAAGRYFDEILNFSNLRLESGHDYIQWLFPLSTPSGHNNRAPVLDQTLIENMRSSTTIRENMKRAFTRMLQFYGLHEYRHDRVITILRSSNWPQRCRVWLTPGNHNFLRITRILTCMRSMGFEQEVQAFYAQLRLIYIGNENIDHAVISTSTHDYWARAAGRL